MTPRERKSPTPPSRPSAESVPLVSPGRIPTDPTKPPGVSFRVRTGVVQGAARGGRDGLPRTEAGAALSGAAVLPRAGTKRAEAAGRPEADMREAAGRPEASTREAVDQEEADSADRPKAAAAPPAPVASTAVLPLLPEPEPDPDPPTRAWRAVAALRRGRHRRGRRVVLLLAGAAVLALAVSSLVRIAPDAGPGTAEAEPRRPWKLGAGPTPGVSATVVAVPPASPVTEASPSASARPTPSGTVTPGPETVPPPAARPSEAPHPAATAAVPRPQGPAHAPPEARTEAPAPAAEPTPVPTPSSAAPAPAPKPSSKGVCVPVLGVCLELRGG
ncbi:hypothetical protein [Streptomyces seoulensis]|uniref:hypothetical protein n=1 Tax=Streptomyces seoulensis TaxID=73044 RepID=UPI001FCBF61A|nr:hypothetical protein [Streptomyces seoulensis]BDH08139.1 hypothetical protein HEK131_53660 [Streptomyces seoulensis]